MFPAAEVQGDTGAGRSSGEAIATTEQLGREIMPPGMMVA
jgi:hypothetical protein